MSIEGKSIKIAENVHKVYKAGYDLANSTALKNPLRFAKTLDFAWNKVAFPENTEIVFHLEKIASISSAFMQSSGIKTAKLILDTPASASFQALFRECDELELLDFSEFPCRPSNLSYFVYGDKKLKSILGTIDATDCSNANNAFSSTSSLQDIRFKEKSIRTNMDFSAASQLTHESLLSILNGLRNVSLNVEITNYRPDRKIINTDPLVTKCKILTSEIFNSTSSDKYVHVTTNAGHLFKVYKSDCGDMWDTVVEAMQKHNYIEFDGAFNDNDFFVIKFIKVIANPDNLSYSLSLGNTNLSKLSEAEKAIATNKGWTLK